MKPFTKLFSSIISSSIWRATKETKVVWITMLAMSDKEGEVCASVGGLADMARVSMAECRSSLAELEAPDDDSRTTTNEGRRIERVDGGWRILNYKKYRELGRGEDRREYFAENKRANRAADKAANCPHLSTPVHISPPMSPIADADADADADAKAVKTEEIRERAPAAPRSKKFTPPTVAEVEEYASGAGYAIDADKFVAYWDAVDWVRGKTKVSKWRMLVVTWVKNNFDKTKAIVPIAKQDEMAWDASPDIEFALQIQEEVRAAQAAKALSK